MDEIRDQEAVGHEDAHEPPKPETQVYTCKMSYSLMDPSGQCTATGEGSVGLFQSTMVLTPKAGPALQVSFRDILEAFAVDYRVMMPMTAGGTLEIFYLGYQYETFCRNLFLFRNELLIRDLLMNEAPQFHGVRGEFQWIPEGGEAELHGPSEIRVYETALIVLPEVGEAVRVPFAEVETVAVQDYKLIVSTEEGSRLILSMVGSSLDPLNRNIVQAIQALDLRTQSWIRETVPAINPEHLRRLAGYMREGRAVRQTDLESIDPGLWAMMENGISRQSHSNMESYRYLSGLAQPSRTCLGVKRGLMGEMTGDYIWFLLPIYNSVPREPGNAVALEALSDTGNSMATYFFRILNRREYADGKPMDELNRSVDKLLKTINRCLLAINFRREPIYLSNEQLNEARFVRYRTALNKIPALGVLRQRYIGRVIHSTREQWEKDVQDLLAFNVRVLDDGARWSK